VSETFSTRPVYIFFLNFPNGISQGFVMVALPYLLVQNGFSVAAAAAVVAIGISSNLWRFVWAPIVDISLSLRKWYWIAVAACTSSLVLFCNAPLKPEGRVYLSVILFLSQVAATFLSLPVTAIIAKSIPHNKKGAASGWLQAGNLGGQGIGGGAGLWLATHYSIPIAGFVLAALSLSFALVILLVKDVKHDKQETIGHEMLAMGKDIVALIKVPVALFTIVMIALPIGSGAASNLWSAIAVEWRTSTDTVALVTGVLSGVISAVGCIVGGFVVDRWNVWTAYFSSGAVCAVVTLAMAVLPFNPVSFVVCVLAYTFALGLINSSFSAIILFAIGRRHAATKYALLASLGNLPVVYMTAFDGWSHDRYNSQVMLVAEALLGFLFIVICLFVVRRMRARQLLVHVTD
jgi:MFS transporter, PAT family, beta-lactamase induction signal transducer AmpG